MEIYQAIILGIVQGLTELLPISSSAHLNLIPWFFNWEMPDSFDVALHLGTLLAITMFFFKDWIGLIKGGYEQVVKKKKSTEGKIFWYIVAVTIPTGIVSLVLDKFSGYICDKFGIEMPEPSEIDLIQDKIQNQIEEIKKYKEKNNIKSNPNISIKIIELMSNVNAVINEEAGGWNHKNKIYKSIKEIMMD